MNTEFDATVIGSGVGGMCAAALLAHAGKRVLLLEKRRYLGGRFSTSDRNGYKCATGGLAVPVGRDMELVCDTVGIASGVKQSTKVGMWLDGEIYDLSKGATRVSRSSCRRAWRQPLAECAMPRASRRSVFTVIADSAALTWRVSRRTASNPAEASPA